MPAKGDWPTNGFELACGSGSFQLNRWAVGQFIWILAGSRHVFRQESSYFLQGSDQLIGLGLLGDILQFEYRMVPFQSGNSFENSAIGNHLHLPLEQRQVNQQTI